MHLNLKFYSVPIAIINNGRFYPVPYTAHISRIPQIQNTYIFNHALAASHHKANTMSYTDSALPTNSTCDICLEPYTQGPAEPWCPAHPSLETITSDKARIKECGHVFHEQCIARWIEETATPSCPMCRAPIPSTLSPESIFDEGSFFEYGESFFEEEELFFEEELFLDPAQELAQLFGAFDLTVRPMTEAELAFYERREDEWLWEEGEDMLWLFGEREGGESDDREKEGGGGAVVHGAEEVDDFWCGKDVEC